MTERAGGERELPFPTSLCHSCAAPPRYVRTGRSTFIFCPLLATKYPPQPVLRCAAYRKRADPPAAGGGEES